MLFNISKQYTVFGVKLASLYVSATLNTSSDDVLSASLCAFATIQTFENNEILSHKFDLIDHLPKYDEFGNPIDDDYIEVPYKADLTTVVVPLNMNAQAFDYVTIARLIQEYLEWIGFATFSQITLVDNATINGDKPSNIKTTVDNDKMTVVITWEPPINPVSFYEMKFSGNNLPVSPFTINSLARAYGVGGLEDGQTYSVSFRAVFSANLKSNWVTLTFTT